MSDRKQFFGILAALCTNLIFGFGFVFAKQALSVAEPLIVIAVRFSVAFLVLNLLLLTGKFRLNFKGKPKLKLLAMALVQPLLYYLLEAFGLDRVSSALSGVIVSLVPVTAMLFAILFLKEKPTLLQVICTVLSIAAIAGISILSNDGSKNYLTGVVFLVGAVICAGLFTVLSREEAKNFSSFERTYMMLLVGSIGYILIALATYRKAFLPMVWSAFCETEFLVAMIYLGVASSVVALLLYNYSTSVISVVQASSFSSIITVVTVMAGVLILKEEFSVWEYILCGLIVLSVWGVNVFTKRKSTEKPL